jgi:hypothetical protein
MRIANRARLGELTLPCVMDHLINTDVWATSAMAPNRPNGCLCVETCRIKHPGVGRPASGPRTDPLGFWRRREQSG